MKLDNIEMQLQRLLDDMVLKNDYREELHKLDLIEGDICVMRRLGAELWKVNKLLKEVSETREWIRKETKLAHGREEANR